MRFLIAVLAVLPCAACASGEAVRTSANTMIIQAGAAPICGGRGALRVAQQTAAIETIRAGFDRYIITGGQAQNNVTATELPGTYRTTVTGFGNEIRGTTTYTPGPTIVSGTHDQGLGVIMFREGDPGASQGISAREALGPDWQEKVQKGIRTCI